MNSHKNEKNVASQNEQFCEQIERTNLQSLIIVGRCRGVFMGEVERRFTGNHILVMKHDGTVLLHSASKGILPVCYVDHATAISIDRDMFDAELEVNARNGEGERLQAIFKKVYSMAGVPERRVPNVVRAVLECVAEVDGQLGRKKIASILAGSSSKCVLGMDLSRLKLYGRAFGRPLKELLKVIDELIVQGYITVLSDSEFPTLSITARGREVLDTGEFDGQGILSALSSDRWPSFAVKEKEMLKHLRNWRREEARRSDVPPFLIMEDRSMLELATRRPSTMDELKLVSGIGQKRAERYGPQLLYIMNWVDPEGSGPIRT